MPGLEAELFRYWLGRQRNFAKMPYFVIANPLKAKQTPDFIPAFARDLVDNSGYVKLDDGANAYVHFWDIYRPHRRVGR